MKSPTQQFQEALSDAGLTLGNRMEAFLKKKIPEQLEERLRDGDSSLIPSVYGCVSLIFSGSNPEVLRDKRLLAFDSTYLSPKTISAYLKAHATHVTIFNVRMVSTHQAILSALADPDISDDMQFRFLSQSVYPLAAYLVFSAYDGDSAIKNRYLDFFRPQARTELYRYPSVLANVDLGSLSHIKEELDYAF